MEPQLNEKPRLYSIYQSYANSNFVYNSNTSIADRNCQTNLRKSTSNPSLSKTNLHKPKAHYHYFLVHNGNALLQILNFNLNPLARPIFHLSFYIKPLNHKSKIISPLKRKHLTNINFKLALRYD